MYPSVMGSQVPSGILVSLELAAGGKDWQIDALVVQSESPGIGLLFVESQQRLYSELAADFGPLRPADRMAAGGHRFRNCHSGATNRVQNAETSQSPKGYLDMSGEAETELAMRQPLLVGVDFTPASEAALVAAARRADAARAPLLVVHVVHESGNSPGFYCKARRPDDVRPISDIAAGMLDSFMQKMIAKYPQWPIIAKAERLLVAGVPDHRILELAKNRGAQQILVGDSTPGRSAVMERILGSVGDWLSRHSSIPVQRVAADLPGAGGDAGESRPLLGIR
jgi:nucleotide-binding universal stress UspA family protein